MNKIKNKILLLILDGVGFNRLTESEITNRILDNLDKTSLKKLEKYANSTQFLNLLLNPIPASFIDEKDSIVDAKALLKSILEAQEELAKKEPDLFNDLIRIRKRLAKEYKYVPWLAEASFINKLRNDNLSIPTKAAGKYVGFEDIDPPVQGNSETGHQQIGNLIMAPQTSLEITEAINDGSYFKNSALIESLTDVLKGKANLNFCFLLSGEHGNDGKVHSSWNHLEGFLELIFTHLKINPERVRMEVILDGRDSPPRSSVEEVGGVGNFLSKLKELLQKHNATDIVSWIIGRGMGMDRDYSENNTKADYELMMGKSDLIVKNIDEVISMVRFLHQQGFADTNMKPILVLDKNANARAINKRDVFIDINFRPDRQRAKIAALAENKEFLQREAQIKGKTWKLDWIENLNLTICTITEYHPDLGPGNGIKIAFPTRPHEHNFFSLFAKITKDSGKLFRYLFLAESNKALHMGYFIRGRREKAEILGSEDREIISSYGAETGVFNDDDFYKKPQMKNFEIADTIIKKMDLNKYDLIAANFSNCDMIGHLSLRHHDAAVKAYEYLDKTLAKLIPQVVEKGYSIIITADHGNIEDFSSTHTANDIFTTFISYGDLKLDASLPFMMRLFDIGWCIADILDIKEEIEEQLPEVPEWAIKEGNVGRSIFID